MAGKVALLLQLSSGAMAQSSSDDSGIRYVLLVLWITS